MLSLLHYEILLNKNSFCIPKPLSYFCLRYISSLVSLIIKCQISNTKGALQSKYHCGAVPYQLYIIKLLISFSIIL